MRYFLYLCNYISNDVRSMYIRVDGSISLFLRYVTLNVVGGLSADVIRYLSGIVRGLFVR